MGNTMSILNNKVTIYENLFSKKPYYITVGKALERIKTGTSKTKVEEIRSLFLKEDRNKLKINLPSICFSGEFEERKDSKLKKHSSLVSLDFDQVINIEERFAQICENDFILSCWLSPSGDGLKALAYIAEPSKHREHYKALMECFSDLDEMNINEARVCFESYDPNIHINANPTPFKKLVIVDKIQVQAKIESENQIINNIFAWITKKGHAFVSGERNIFLFKFASACCRFGVDKYTCNSYLLSNYVHSDSSFKQSECERTVDSAYRVNKDKFGSAEFSNETLVDKKTSSEIEIINDIPEDGKPIDVIYAEDVMGDVIDLYDNGYENLNGIGVPEIDTIFKLKKGEITLLTGYGNQGKSTVFKWYFLMRAILYGEKYCFFSPEDAPAHEFYFHASEMLLACNLAPQNRFRASKQELIKAQEFINQHFFFVYPKDVAPSPEYVKEKFLQMIIVEKVDGILIDPFNQLDNDYKGSLGRDKYLESFLSSYAKFSRDNHVFGCIVAHPKNPRNKNGDGNYDCPEVFDVADGAMWNNKMDDILVYHRPQAWTHPESTECELHSKKIRRQYKAKKGMALFHYDRATRRYIFDGIDPMGDALKRKGIIFKIESKSEFEIEINQNGYPASWG